MKAEVHMKVYISGAGFGPQFNFRRFAFVHAADAPHQAPHRKLASAIAKKNLAGARATIAPALQDREVLVAFAAGNVASAAWMRASMD